MRRNVMFERGRMFRPGEGREARLRLNPERGARAGHYAPYDSSEYSDDYFGPGDSYERRMFRDEVNAGRQTDRSTSAGIVMHERNVRPTARPTDSGHYGELHRGDQSWASLKRHMDERSRERTSFRGRGPKGYVRSDARLQEIICEGLSDDHEIDASNVSVEAKNGEVTLTGNVETRREKYLIEELVDQCGASAIHNQIRTSRTR